jgi:Flp pilus assembly protein TadG
MKKHPKESAEAPIQALSIGRRLRSLLHRREHGSSLIEFALCLPPLFLLMTGIFAFGITIGNYVTLTNATSVGAMQLAISRSQTLDPCATVASAIYGAAPNLKQSSLTFAFSLNGHAYNGTTCSSSSYTTGAPGNLTQGTTAQVTVTYPCSLKVYNQNNFPSCTLTAKTAEVVQ